jgi:hypothetical protein
MRVTLDALSHVLGAPRPSLERGASLWYRIQGECTIGGTRTSKQQQQHDYYMRNRERSIAAAREYNLQHPEQAREARRRWQDAHPFSRRHGMQPADWVAMFEAQHGQCYLCGDQLSADRRKTHIDHDHSCCPSAESCGYCRRGLACNNCNTLIGMASDDPDRLRRIADNLEATLALVRERIKDKPIQGELLAIKA